MKRSLRIFVVLLLGAGDAVAGHKPQPGTITSHTAVACGTKKSKKQDIDLLCQQYVVRSGATDYTIRQPKPEQQEIIPLNSAIQFTLDKNTMKFKLNGTSFKFLVVSQAAASSAATAPSSFGSVQSCREREARRLLAAPGEKILVRCFAPKLCRWAPSKFQAAGGPYCDFL
jgi:hypothetical protein